MWEFFWTDEPLNSAVFGGVLSEENKKSLTSLLYETMSYDQLTAIVAWDTINSKVGCGYIFIDIYFIV